MLDRIRRYFEQHIASPVEIPDAQAREQGLRVACAALLFEVGRADFEIRGVEREAIEQAVQRKFGLDPAETAELVRLAEEEVEESTSLYQFTRLVNDHFDPQARERLVELMWRVAYANDRVDPHQEALVRRVADLIHVPHSRFVLARHRAEAARDQASRPG
jgi:uncharacterized tellurite resistance protein B-like protein